MRHVYIIEPDADPTEAIDTATAADCAEVVQGIPLALAAQVPDGATLPGAFLVDPQVTLTPSDASIPPDGTTTAAVTYSNEGGAASVAREVPTEVTFTVNGTVITAGVTDGIATIEVVSASAGDVVTVTCEGLTTTIAVTGG